MIKSVEMFGIPPEITKQSKIELDLKEGAGLKDVISGLKQKFPAMDGTVFQHGEDRVTDYYTIIVNGQFQPPDSNIKISPDDRIVLVILTIGG